MDLNYAGFNIFVFFVVYADDPNNDPKVSGDPYKTLFVARLVSVLLILCKFYFLWFTLCSGVFFFLLQNYETTESKIKRELESYGPIKQVGIFLAYPWGFGKRLCSNFLLNMSCKKSIYSFQNIPFKSLWTVFLFISVFSNEQKNVWEWKLLHVHLSVPDLFVEL